MDTLLYLVISIGRSRYFHIKNLHALNTPLDLSKGSGEKHDHKETKQKIVKLLPVGEFINQEST